MKFDSGIFEALVKSLDEDEVKNDILENTEPEDITESINITLNDETINKANCSLIAYNVHVDENDDSEAYNPKKNPDRAVDILLEYPQNNITIEIYLDTPSMEWDSLINGKNKLSPEQMQQFFKTDFYHDVYNRLTQIWPSSDEFFSKLLNAIKNKKYMIDCFNGGENIEEDSNVFRKGNIDKEKSREKNAAGKEIRTRSGRKIITPSNFDVRRDDNEAYFVWPSKGKEFKYSQWADWTHIKPVARIRFKMGQFVYGISFSPIEEDDENRGAKAYNLTLLPHLQYLTPEETQEMMDLSIVQQFLRHATKRISKYLSVPDEEVLEKVNKPEKCTIDDIRKTKHILKNTLKAIRAGRHDTYIYT